ncbi:MAG: helix-turn-helix domain-containing protein [Myxococcota bacterium]
MNPVLTEAELADLLRLSPVVIGRLLAETDLPRVQVAGQVRFLRDQVIAWLGEQRSPLLAARPLDAEAEAPKLASALPPADEAEGPFVAAEALAALSAVTPKTEDNLLRLQARDGLIAVADALLPSLGRRSQGRLQPAAGDAERTGLWRAEDAGGAPISSIAFTFSDASAPSATPVDERPRLVLTLEPRAVSFALVAPTAAGPASAEILAAAKQDGAKLTAAAADSPWSVRFRHTMASRPPTLNALVTRLDADARHLVPLWLSIVGPRAVEGG